MEKKEGLRVSAVWILYSFVIIVSEEMQFSLLLFEEPLLNSTKWIDLAKDASLPALLEANNLPNLSVY